MAVPYGSDYTAANTPAVGGFGLFTFQIVNQDLNATTSAALFSALTSPTFSQKVSFYLTSKSISLHSVISSCAYVTYLIFVSLQLSILGFQSGTAVQATATQAPVIFEPTPLVFENAAGSVSAHKGVQWLVTLGLTLGASVMLMRSAAV